MTSGPMPPSAPSRTMPSASIQKWTGRAMASHVSAAFPSPSSPSGNVAFRLSREGGDGALLLLDVDRDDDQARVGVARREPVHQRELVLAGRAPRRHEVDPDRLARAGSRDRSSRRRPGARPAAAPAGRCGTDPSRRWPRGRARRSAERETAADGLAVAIAIGGLGVARRRRVGGEHEEPPEQPAPRRRRRPPGRRRSTGVPSCRAEGTSTSGRRRFGGTAATMPLPWVTSRIGSARESFPALLTALGVTFLAAGVLSLTTPVAADPLTTPAPSASPARRRSARRRARSSPCRRSVQAGRRRPAHRSRPTGSPRGCASPRSRSTCRSSRQPDRLPGLQRRDVPRGRRGSASPARVGRSTSTRTPGPGCSCRC